MRQVLKVGLIVILSSAVVYTGWFGYQSARLYFGPSEKSLSLTGFDPVAAAAGTMESTFRFQPQYPFWSDGAEKMRYIYLPPKSQIDNSDPDRWNFPRGTRIWKEFKRDDVDVEVRMLFKFGDQPWDWDMSTYLWRDDRSDADKLVFGKSNINNTPHDIPSPSSCETCHSSDQNRRPLGITAMQLPWEHATDLSITQLVSANLLTNPPLAPYQIPGDELTRTALGYLDTNCGSCHYDGSTFVPDEVPMLVNLTTTTIANVAETNAYRTLIDASPLIPGLGTDVYVSPGNPEESFVYLRMTRRDNGGWQMPPIATETVDQEGAQLVANWIKGLK